MSLLTPELRNKYDELVQGSGYITPSSSETSKDISLFSIEQELNKMAL